MKIEVYSDGSATVASKPGGYGWVLVIDGIKHSEGNGYMDMATNNDAELEAAIMGLAAVLRYKMDSPSLWYNAYPEVTLVSDSEIVLGWANGTYRFKQIKKMQKFEQLRTLVSKLRVKTRWVEGHTGDEHNERCDELANIARKRDVPVESKKTRKTPKNEVQSIIEQLTLRVEALEKELATLKGANGQN